MDFSTLIRTRRTCRAYSAPATDAELRAVVEETAMSTPSAGGAMPWKIIVLGQKTVETKIAPLVGPTTPLLYAKPVVNAKTAVLLCADLSRERYGPAEGHEMRFAYEDVSALSATLGLVAQAHGLGTCWCGVYPEYARVDLLREALELPEHLVPVTLMAIGHPAEGYRAVAKPERLEAQEIVYMP